MDDVLELLAGTGPEYGGGDTNHGPMAAEALCFLGREEMAIRWAENYKRRKLEPHISAPQRILSNEWKEYLGRRNYFDGWKSLFHHEIESSGWENTLRCWIPRFLPGIVSAAAHGALRTAHAVRSLEKKETALRKDELCSGLGYWAATFQTLPEAPYNKQKLEASEAIKALHLIPIDKREEHDQISDGLNQLKNWPDFAPVINMLDVSSGFDKSLLNILETFIRAYIPNADTNLFPAVHAVTGPATLQLLEKYIEESDKTRALKYAWQASAGLHITFDTNTQIYKNKIDSKTKHDTELIDDAIRSQDEHAIKFTEVCLRLNHANANPIYKFAAEDAISRFAARREA